MRQNEQHFGYPESPRLDRARSVFVVNGHFRTCLGCDRIMTQVEAAQHSPSLCCRGEHGIELHGRVIQSAAEA